MRSRLSDVLGISLDGRRPVPTALEQARTAERAGAATIWVASHLFYREPFSLAAAILAATTRARVGLMAVSPHVVHPLQIAMAAATLDELAPGRVLLSLGTGAPGDLADAGIEPERPVRALREAIELIRLLLSGEPVSYKGEVFRVSGRRLEGRHAIPILLAASGPQTLALAGGVADGVVLSTASSVEFVRWAVGEVERRAGGRRRERVGLVYAATADDTRQARDRFRRLLAVTLRGRHHARNVRLAGTSLDQEAARRAVADEDWTRAEALITDEIVQKHAACGTPVEVRARLAEYRAAGLDEVVLASLRDPEEITRALAAARG